LLRTTTPVSPGDTGGIVQAGQNLAPRRFEREPGDLATKRREQLT
jgi:hypothetical protein